MHTTSVASMINGFTNEHSGHSPVECLMNRAKLGFVALLPVLWILASGESLLASCDGCNSTGLCGSQSILDGGKPCPSQPLSGSDAAASTVHSRVVKHSGKSSLTPSENICRTFSLQSNAVARPAPRTSPPGLATSWQFTCRAALDPRAPSFAS